MPIVSCNRQKTQINYHEIWSWLHATAFGKALIIISWFGDVKDLCKIQDFYVEIYVSKPVFDKSFQIPMCTDHLTNYLDFAQKRGVRHDRSTDGISSAAVAADIQTCTGFYIGVSKNRGTPQMDGEFSWKTLLKMDDLGVPLFWETSIYHVDHSELPPKLISQGSFPSWLEGKKLMVEIVCSKLAL